MSDSLQPVLSVIIVSFNTCELTLDCLRTLMPELENFPAEVFIVDNASADSSVASIREHFPSVKLIVNSQNTGFGAANNQALCVARGRYFMLLNTDAFPRKGAVRDLVDLMESRPEIGVLGPRLLNRDGTLQRSCFRFPTPAQAWLENLWVSRLLANHPRFGDYRHWDHATEREVDFVIGACLLMRREVYEEVGGFDEHFFMYQEESDWQLRVKSAGWPVVFTPTAEVVHFGGESSRNARAQINRHFFNSLDRFALKHHGWLGFAAIRAAMLVGCSMRAVLWAIVSIRRDRRAQALDKLKLLRWLLCDQLFSAAPSSTPAMHGS